MNIVFADTAYWVAVANPKDEWASAAARARKQLGDAQIVTCDEIVTEFLDAVAAGGRQVRGQAVKMARQILAATNVTVVSQSRTSLLGGLELYESRADKGYSPTDCIAMQAMYEKRIYEVLTSDHHFAQEGFRILMVDRP